MERAFILVFALILAIIVFGIINTDVIMDVILIIKDIEEIEGLNGRTRLWRYVFRHDI